MRGKKARALRRQAYRAMTAGVGGYRRTYQKLKVQYANIELAREVDRTIAKVIDKEFYASPSQDN